LKLRGANDARVQRARHPRETLPEDLQIEELRNLTDVVSENVDAKNT